MAYFTNQKYSLLSSTFSGKDYPRAYKLVAKCCINTQLSAVYSNLKIFTVKSTN